MPKGVYQRSPELKKKLREGFFLREVGKKTRFKKDHGFDKKTIKKMSSSAKKKGLIPPSRKGEKVSLEYRRELSKRMAGKRSNFYKDGLGFLRRSDRQQTMGTVEYKIWRDLVFERDNYTCVNCGMKGCCLEADHIKPWVLYPELRYEVHNGRTLCRPCHRRIGWRGNQYKLDLGEENQRSL